MASQLSAAASTPVVRLSRRLHDLAAGRVHMVTLDRSFVWFALLMRFAILGDVISRLRSFSHLQIPPGNVLWAMTTLLFGIYLLNQMRFLNQPERLLSQGALLRSLALDLLFFSLFFVINRTPESNLIYAYLLPLITSALYLPFLGTLGLLVVCVLLQAAALLLIGMTGIAGQTPLHHWFVLDLAPLRSSPLRILLVNTALLSLGSLPLARMRLLSESLRSSKANYQHLLRLLTERSRAFARGDDLDDMVDIALRAAKDELHCEAAAVFIYRPRSGRFERYRAIGVENDWFSDESYGIGEGLTGMAVDEEGNGRSVRINDVKRQPLARHSYLARYAQQLPSGHTEHLVAVPLHGANRAFGILRAVNKLLPSGSLDPQGFTPDDQDILAALAVLVALAYSSQRRTEKTQAVFEVHEALIQTLSADQVCRKLAEVIVRIGYSACCVLLRDPWGEPRPQAVEGLAPEAAARLGALDELRAERLAVLASGRTRSSHDLAGEAGRQLGAWMRSNGLCSVQRLPLIHRRVVIGVLEVYGAAPHHFYHEESETLKMIAAQATAAITSAQLSERNQRQMQDLTKLAALITRMTRHDNEHQLFDDAVHRIAGLIQAEDCSIFWVNNDQQTIDMCASNCIPRSLFRRRVTSISAQPRAGLVAYVAATGERLQFKGDDYKAHLAWNGNFLDHLSHLPSRRCTSLLLHPIRNQDGAIVGVLKAENKQGAERSEGFTHADHELVNLLTTQISLAVEKIRRIVMLRQLHTVAQQIAEITEPREVLTRIAAAARVVVPADEVVICPFDRAKGLLCAERAAFFSERAGYDPAVRLAGDPVMAQVMADRRGVVAVNHPEAGRHGVSGSTIAVALRVGDDLVGVMLCDFRARRHFAAGELGDAETLGKLAAIAIQNANLFDAATRAGHELDAMQTLTQTALAQGNLALDRVVDVVLKTICGALGYDFCAMGLVNETRRSIECRGASGIANRWQAESRHALSSQDIQAHIVRTGETLILMGWDHRFDQAIYRRHGHDRLVRVFTPIWGRNGVIGTIEAGHELRNRAGISKEEANTLCRYVAQVALVIDSVRQLEESRRYAEQLRRLHALSQGMTSLHPQASAADNLDQIAAVVAELFGAETTTQIALASGGSTGGPLTITHGDTAHDPAKLDKWVQMALAGRQVVVHNGPFDPDEATPVACAPIAIGSELIGALCVLYPHEHWFSEHEREFLEHCAAQLATAIVNARLHRGLTERRDWFEGELNHFYHDLVGSSLASAAHVLECIGAGKFGPATSRQLLWAERAIDELAWVGRRVEHLMSLRREDGGEPRLNYVPTAIAELVEERFRAIAQEASAKRIALSCVIADDCIDLELELDRERIAAALDNLLRNAVKFTPADGRIDLQVMRHDALEIHVDDSGIGIDPAFHERIFEKYFQLRTGRGEHEKGRGSGLGLWIARHFVHLHNGRIVVQGRPAGGTRFTIALPLPEQLAHTNALQPWAQWAGPPTG